MAEARAKLAFEGKTTNSCFPSLARSTHNTTERTHAFLQRSPDGREVRNDAIVRLDQDPHPLEVIINVLRQLLNLNEQRRRTSDGHDEVRRENGVEGDIPSAEVQHPYTHQSFLSQLSKRRSHATSSNALTTTPHALPFLSLPSLLTLPTFSPAASPAQSTPCRNTLSAGLAGRSIQA